ncbi:cardiolipin synthase [bacterium]|nr:cardiolipin synthase [bacterium]
MNDVLDFLARTWPNIVGAILICLAAVAACHAVMYKRDPRSSIGWAGIIILFPIVGAALYVLIGINRVKRKAAQLRGKRVRAFASGEIVPYTPERLATAIPVSQRHLATLDLVVSSVTRRPLLPGNAVEALVNGDEAFPRMLEAIRSARTSIGLATYIFDNDPSGRQFIDALADATKRGVQVRVLIDSVGSRYSFPSSVGRLRRAGVIAHRFMPSLMPWRAPYMNLRNHRKILVVDGALGFTGGMNIRHGNMVSLNPSHAVKDLHFEVRGPIVAHLQETFAEDWQFTTRETLEGDAWFPRLADEGDVIARGITDGPDEDLDKLLCVITGALACAQKSVRIMTPYFLPNMALISALNTAAMRGVNVEIILPSVNNLRTVGWAMTANLWQVLEWGCSVWLSDPPFDHSKLMVVDDEWSLVGSANWDQRSLRLNFEFNIECYSPVLAARLNAIFDAKRTHAKRITLKDVDSRPLPRRLRDSIARLFMPYL